MWDPDTVHRLQKSWRIVMHSLCRTKRVRHLMTTPSSKDSSNKRSCFPCELARLGVANGSTLAAGIFLVVGYVAGDVTGPGVVVSLVIAALVSLLTGLCYAEFISHYPAQKTTATSSQYFYMLTGEFTSTIVAWTQLSFYTASGAAYARAISSTFDFLVNGAITNITDSITYKGYSTDASPDFVAGAIVILVVMVIIFGGKQLECLTVCVSLLSLIALIPLTIFSGIYGIPENWTEGKGFFPFQHAGVFAGSAICVFLFGGYDVIATSSKDKSKSTRVVGFAILSSNIVNLLALLIIAIFMTLLVPYSTLAEGRPLPTIFYQYGGQWGKYTIGISAMFCLGSAVMNNISSMVYLTYLMGADGVIPRGCGKLNKRLSTPITAAIVLGTFCALKAILLKFGLLLEVIAIATLVHQTIICAATMATRCRPLEDDASFNYDNNPETNGAAMRTRKTRTRNKKKTWKKKTILRSPKNRSAVTYYDSDSDNSDGNETDIDALVDEYKEKQRTTKLTHFEGPTKNKLTNQTATVFTSTLAAVSTTLIVIWCVAIGAILNCLLPFLLNIDPWVISSVILFLFLLVVTTVILVLQPRRQTTPAFYIPMFPVIPVLGIGINVFLLFTVSIQSWILFAIWIAQGLCFYFCYGICNSVESRRYSYQMPEEELILLQPIPEQPLNEQIVNNQGRRELNIGYQLYHETK